MADQKVSALSAITQADVDDTLLLYVVDVTGGTVSRKVTKANLFAGTVKTQLTLVMPSGPVGSSSAFVGGINIPSNSLTFSSTAQTGDYSTNFIGQATLVDGTGSGTITNAASIDIVGAPIASTGVTITNNYALRVRAGTTLLQAVTGAGVFTSTGGITMSSSDITLAGNKLKADTNNYFYQPSVNQWSLFTNTVEVLRSVSTLITSFVDIGQTTTKKIGFNVGLTTYGVESSSGVLDLYAGSNFMARMDSSLPISHGISHPAGIAQHSLTKFFEDGFNYSTVTSGNPTNGPWTLNSVVGVNTGVMLDGIDGGFKMTTDGSAFHRGSITLNNIRNYDSANCTIYGIVTLDDTSGNLYVLAGVSDGSDLIGGTSKSVSAGAAATAFYTIASGDGATETNTATSIAITTGKFQFKIVCGASNLKLYTLVSGVWTLQVTKTSNRPTGKVQPIFMVGASDGTARHGSIQRLRVENDS